MLARLWLACEAFWLILLHGNPEGTEATAKARTERIDALQRQADMFHRERDEAYDETNAMELRNKADAAEHARTAKSLTEARAAIASLESSNNTLLSKYREACEEITHLKATREHYRKIFGQVEEALDYWEHEPLEIVRASNYVDTTNAAESDGLPQDEESEGPLFGTLKDGQFHEGVVIEGGLVMRGHPAT